MKHISIACGLFEDAAKQSEDDWWNYYKSINEGNEMFNDWLKLLIKLSKSNYVAKDFICPECGQKSVEFMYVGDPATRIGYLPIWCNNCNNGIHISRVEIPQGVKLIKFDDSESIENMIPNFKEVAPGE